MVVKLDDVCERIYAGGDVPKDRFSDTKTDIYNIPIYANAEANQGLYGYTDRAREFDNAVTVAARGTIGYSAIRTEPFLPVVRLITVVPNRTKITLSYLYYALRHYKPKSSGTSIPQLTVPNIKKYTFNLYDINRQEIITTTLDKLQSIITHRKRQLAKLDELVKARFVEMFGDPVENPFGWDKLALEEMCSSIVDCPHSTPNYTNEKTGYMCIRTSIVKKNAILWNNIEYISEEEFLQRIKRKKPQKGDIIYTREGAILGIAAIIDRDCNVALGQRSMLLSPNTSMFLPEFICNAMNFDSFFERVTQGTSGSASPHINVADIRAFRIIAPPMDIQNEFAAFVERVDKSKFDD